MYKVSFAIGSLPMEHTTWTTLADCGDYIALKFRAFGKRISFAQGFEIAQKGGITAEACASEHKGQKLIFKVTRC